MNQKGLEYSKNGAELRKIQKELVDTILTKPEELEKITNIQLASRKGFHQYSYHNICLANWQLWCRTGETCELLAPYNKWKEIKLDDGNKIHRNVKKGEKALRILAPFHYKWTSQYDDDKRTELLKGKGSNVLKTAQKIIDDLKLSELLDSKTTIPSSKWEEINWVGVKE